VKKGKYHILVARILLFCFMAGQTMIYAHQHSALPVTGKLSSESRSSVPHQTFKETCDLCDMMLHNAMLAAYQVYLTPTTVAGHVYQSIEYSFTSIQLILAGGRAPPVSQS